MYVDYEAEAGAVAFREQRERARGFLNRVEYAKRPYSKYSAVM